SYTTRVNAPSITQLSPVIDNSDPLRLYIGNPDLNAEYNHDFRANFHAFSQFSSTSFFTSLSGSLTENKIITARNTDEQFREVSTPINIDNEKKISLYSSFGRPFKPIHSRFNINANLAYTKTQNVINTDLLDVNRWSRSAGISFSNMNSEVLEYNFGGQWTFTDNYFATNESLNQNTLLENYFVDATLTVWKKWRVQGSYNYNLYSSDAFGDNQSLPLLKASISRYILPGDKGQVLFSVFDALDENRGLSRTADINYIEEVRSNSIGRYAMLSFIYSINGKGQESPGGVRIIERR
ncbi:MAG: outer membrane beta-barrel family protein, partial [Bacteroidota bacterium]|nr:outer membrane beta-barrel family protein [Bacteroidota bacterium]